ncbi:hypothetical protein Tco_1013216 [Tanacetum coccineum]
MNSYTFMGLDDVEEGEEISSRKKSFIKRVIAYIKMRRQATQVSRNSITRDRVGAHERLVAAYFTDNPMYNEKRFRQTFRMARPLFNQIANAVTAHSAYFQFPTGRVKVPAGRYVVPIGKDNVIVSAGRSKVIPASRTTLVLIVTTSRYVVPTGRVKVPAGRYVVPTGKDNVIKVPAGRYVVPTGKDNVRVSAGRSKVIHVGRTILVLVVLCLL